MIAEEAAQVEGTSGRCPRHADQTSDRVCRRCGCFACRYCCGSPELGPLCLDCREGLGFGDRREFLICPSCDSEPHIGTLSVVEQFHFVPLIENVPRFFSRRWNPTTHGAPWWGIGLSLRFAFGIENRYGFLRRCAACDFTIIDFGRRVGWWQAGRIKRGTEDFHSPLAESCEGCNQRYDHGLVDLLSVQSYHKEGGIGAWISFGKSMFYDDAGFIERAKRALELNRNPNLPAAYCTRCRVLVFRVRAGLSAEKLKDLYASMR